MIELKNISKTFETSDGNVHALKDVNLTINDGEIYGIIGMSGAGKSTLVRCINMLERPTSGEVIINGENIGKLSDKQLRSKRRKMTMIFQGFNLLMQRNCLDNICFPLELSGMKKKDARVKAAELLETVGLPDKGYSYPAQLSGGQQQRIAIARALTTNPEILLCDEATSALDPKTTQSILELIQDINKKLGITVIVITHQMSVVEKICDKVAILDNGSVVEEGLVSEVFTNPKSDAAKRLVFPGGDSMVIPEIASGALIRLVYNGAMVADTPLIAKMAIEEGIAANILAAQTKCIGDKVFGNMLLEIKDDDKFDKAVQYLQNTPNIYARRVNTNA